MADQTPTRTNEEKAIRNWIVRALSGVIDASFINYAPLRGPKPNANDFITVQVVSRKEITKPGEVVRNEALGVAFRGERRRENRIRAEINVYGPNHAQNADLIRKARWSDRTFNIERLGDFTILTGLAGEDWRGRSRAEVQFIWTTTDIYEADVIETVAPTITDKTPNVP